MKGDFSSWRDERRQNFTGVLHQQGRVLLDADWNAATAINNDWQDAAAHDAFGAGVAAVPADQPNAFKIKTAVHNSGDDHVELTVGPGRTWADGLLAEVFSEPDPEVINDVTRMATYLQPPIQDPAANTGSIAADERDAVILEVWRQEINGFQLPDLLIEPALGGPDTTERIHTSFAFRLMRLEPGDTCESIVSDLQDNFADKGKLKVTLAAPPPGGTPDCPMPAAGGYTGFEHNLYRIEIANVDAGPPQFKWSQYGGGLVGRGHFEAGKVEIRANLQAITNSGLLSFYLEAVEYDAGLGHWRVTCGAPATLSNDVLTLGATTFGLVPTNPQAQDTTFFRLWNGIARVEDFADDQLPDNVGIFLDFDAPAAGNYVPGDYWTFAVRAGGINNAQVLVGKDIGGGTFVRVPPKGVHYHRVPLAVLTWANNQDLETPFEDCRHLFQPLTRLATCCSYRVGDGMHSWGDFEKIQDAVDSLPAEGGEVCVLPGTYIENVVLENKQNITIKGCGGRSRVVSPPGSGGDASPAFHIKESQKIKILSLSIEAHDTGVGVLLEGRPRELIAKDDPGELPVLDITLENLTVRAATRSAIEAQVAYNVTIRRCRIEMKDVATGSAGVYFIGEDSLIEENEIIVADEARRVQGFDIINPLDPGFIEPAGASLGGLHLGGGCERIRVVNNVIARGISNGITLGSLLVITRTTEEPVHPQPPPKVDECGPCDPGTTTTTEPDDPTTTVVSAGDLYQIVIEGNRIFNMGLNGISVVGFFPLGKIDEFITVHQLLIQNNDIRRCLYRHLADVTQSMLNAQGYGGIALADVDELIIRDNFIVDNGPDFREPICGIFVLHGEGIEISRNHIVNNGAKPVDSEEPAESIKRGARGGIYIVFAVAPTVLISLPFIDEEAPVQSGFPALKVDENVVSVPVGQALAVMAVGPVSASANQFTSRGMTFRSGSTFIASTVFIINLGFSNEFFLQLLLFGLLKNANQNTTSSGQPDLDDLTLGRSLSNGNVLFTDNQCNLDLMESGQSFSASSILILSLDDIGFQNNQCECNLLDDFILANAILVGTSVRATDNRFKDGSLLDLFKQSNLPLSAITVGLFNTTTDNQSTHCLWIMGHKNLTVDHSNVSLKMLQHPSACCDLLVHKKQCFDAADRN